MHTKLDHDYKANNQKTSIIALRYKRLLGKKMSKVRHLPMFDRNKESNRKSHLKAGRAGGDVGSEGGWGESAADSLDRCQIFDL